MNRETEPMGPWEVLIRTVGSLLKTFERELMESIGLPLTWFDVLLQLDGAPEGRLRMQALADSVVLSRSGLTRLVDRMEKAGLVGREHSSEDRRGYYALLTGEGRRVLSQAKPIHDQGVYEHFTQHLDDGDLDAVLAAMIKIRRIELPPAVETPSDSVRR